MILAIVADKNMILAKIGIHCIIFNTCLGGQEKYPKCLVRSFLMKKVWFLKAGRLENLSRFSKLKPRLTRFRHLVLPSKMLDTKNRSTCVLVSLKEV